MNLVDNDSSLIIRSKISVMLNNNLVSVLIEYFTVFNW